MPIETTMLDAMLGTFRNMMRECRDKNMQGDDIDSMQSAMDRMEQLGREMSDFGAFSGQMMQEGLFTRFSDHYGKALAAEAQKQYGVSGPYDDATDKRLLQQSIDAYKDAIVRLKENKEATRKMMAHASDADVLIKDKAIEDAVNKVIALGEQQHITYAEFLCAMMEQGLDKLMEGSTTSRDAQVYLLEAAKATASSSYEIQKEEDKLKLYDELSAASPVKVPPALMYALGCEQIEWQHAPAIKKWNRQKDAWQKAVFLLDEWITAYCSFAPYIEPWAAAKDPKASVEESQSCVPGKLRVWEKINKRYFGTSLPGMFKHESFAWDVQHHWMYWSQEYMNFLLQEVEPACIPFRQPNAGLIKKAEYFHNEKKKINPNVGEPALRYAKYFDSYFGSGEYAKRFGVPDKIITNAVPWA